MRKIVIFDTSAKKWFYSRGGRLHPSEPRLHEDKIPFSLEYRTLFFGTMWEKLNFGHAFLLERVQNRALRTECENNFFHTPWASVHLAHARIKRHALNQALHMSYEKIVFDTRVRKWFYPLVVFSPSLRSGANVHHEDKITFSHLYRK